MLQLTIRGVSRLRSAFATVRIQITRVVDQMPFFINTPYRTTILFDRVLNDTLLSVTARDQDLVVNHYFTRSCFLYKHKNYPVVD